MCEFLNRESEQLGVSNSELIRRILEHYRDGRSGDLRCPHCEGLLEVVV